MSRIEYDEDMHRAGIALQLGREKQAISSKRGRAFLLELERVLVAMRPQRLISDVLCDQQGEVCALGAVARSRLVQQGVSWAEAELALCPYNGPDPWLDGEPDLDAGRYAMKHLGITATMAWLIQEANDDPIGPHRTPEQRHTYVLGKVRAMIAGRLPVGRLP